MSRPPNLCVYCGLSGITREHIRGSWSRKFSLGPVTKTQHFLTHFPNGNRSNDPNISAGVLERQGGPRSATLKIACGNCNNGWMKDIVDKAIPLLVPMSHGYWGNISEISRTNLSSWIVLFVMSYEFADKSTVCVPQSERTLFSKNLVPSDRWHIAIGHGDPTPGLDETIHRAMRLSDEHEYIGHRQLQLTAFYFGSILALVYYSDFDITFDFSELAAKNGLAVLWPLRRSFAKPFRCHFDEAVNDLIESASMAIESSI